ncbi:MAG: holo-ACP synthase [Puniceicoccales bacterium]|jgi:holo-[acyl-carrier protein] synthase|nr:holo-ACP synthase [Puniceicoccales bacterium]
MPVNPPPDQPPLPTTAGGTGGAATAGAATGTVVGVGVDLAEVARMRGIHERHGDAFLERVFTAAERAYCLSLADPWPSFAARWAAKEAVAKALGTGFSGGLDFTSIAVAHDAAGAPVAVLDAKARTLLAARGGAAVHLSLTHTAALAQAFAVVTR